MSDGATDASEIARHYGNMRFAMFTVFTAILGALIMIPLDKDRLPLVATGNVHWLLGIAGIAMSLGFAAGEARIAYLVHFYQKKATSFHTGCLGPQAVWGWMVCTVMVLPYVFAIAFWIIFLCGGLAQTEAAAGAHWTVA